jgi:hypothetical protein
MSARAQTIMIWWGLIMMFIYGFTMWLGFDMVPPPTPKLSAEEVAAFYATDNLAKRLGAMIGSWTGAFMVPIYTVAAIQIGRFEDKLQAWSKLCLISGGLMAIFLMLPPLFWGIAAYSPGRPAEVTMLMHEIAMMTLVTTDQVYIFAMVAIGYVSLAAKHHDALSPFPRWMGYFTLFAAIAFEVGALAFIPKSGPFSWNGAVVFWMPFCVFGVWVVAICFTMLGAIKRQAAADAS